MKNVGDIRDNIGHATSVDTIFCPKGTTQAKSSKIIFAHLFGRRWFGYHGNSMSRWKFSEGEKRQNALFKNTQPFFTQSFSALEWGTYFW